jgi:hypothetical protein
VDFLKNGFLPRPSLRNAKLRPGLTDCRPFRAILGKLMVMGFGGEMGGVSCENA